MEASFSFYFRSRIRHVLGIADTKDTEMCNRGQNESKKNEDSTRFGSTLRAVGLVRFAYIRYRL